MRSDLRCARRPAAGGRALSGRRRGVGGVRRVRPGEGLSPRPGPVGAVSARPLRRGTGPGRPAARHRRPVRRRALVDADGRGLRAVQRQPSGDRRVPVHAPGRPRLRARQPAPDRRRRLGSRPRGVTTWRPRCHAALDRQRREHRPRGRRRRARRPVPVRHGDRPRRPRRTGAGDVVPGSGHRAPAGVPRPGRLDGVGAGGPQGAGRRSSRRGWRTRCRRRGGG